MSSQGRRETGVHGRGDKGRGGGGKREMSLSPPCTDPKTSQEGTLASSPYSPQTLGSAPLEADHPFSLLLQAAALHPAWVAVGCPGPRH